MLIDTHAHLDYPDFADDLDAIVARAGEAGVTRILTIGTGIESSRRAIALAERFANVTTRVDEEEPTQPETPLSRATTPPVQRRVMLRGMVGDDVREWQAQLRADGWAIAVDGHFGTQTDAATRGWQAARGLEPDGVVGPKTRAAIGTPPKRTSTGSMRAVKE